MGKNKQHQFEVHVKELLSNYPKAKICWLAYSGGLDSHVLLDVLNRIRDTLHTKITAIHINHGLSPNAESWQNHCQNICADYAIDFQNYSVKIPKKNNDGIEATARKKRYEIFQGLVKENDLLLTAHHQNDQTETLLLQLLRGAGPEGLASMPEAKPFSEGTLLRPLLTYSREDILEYATANSLNWVDDESNDTNEYDRNYLRNELLPQIINRWPGAVKTISRAASHQAEVIQLFEEIAETDLHSVCTKDNAIHIPDLRKLSFARQKNVIRTWIEKKKLTTPNAVTLKRILNEIVAGNPNNNPYVSWQGGEVRRYREFLYAMEPLQTQDKDDELVLKLNETVELSSGVLKLHEQIGKGIAKDKINNKLLTVRFRQGGEKIQPAGREHHHELKTLFQDEGVLPWLRERLPLIYADEDLIAVGDLWFAEKYAASGSEASINVEWDWNNN